MHLSIDFLLYHRTGCDILIGHSLIQLISVYKTIIHLSFQITLKLEQIMHKKKAICIITVHIHKAVLRSSIFAQFCTSFPGREENGKVVLKCLKMYIIITM